MTTNHTPTPPQVRVIDCADSWMRAEGLPTYSALTARVAELESALTAIKARTVQSPKGALSDDVYDLARAALKGQA